MKSASKAPERVDGELIRLPSDVSSQLFSGVEGRELQNKCYPFYLESEGFRYPGYWAIGIAWVFFGLFWKFARPARERLQDINKHPVLKRVKCWGNPVGVSLNVQREISNSVLYKSGDILITNNYVVRTGFFTFNILRFHDLLWAYKKVTKRSVNFVPTGKDFAVIMYFYGGVETHQADERKVDEGAHPCVEQSTVGSTRLFR